MISLDHPPVSDRDLPDQAALRRSTLAAAGRSTARPAVRRTPVVLALVAAVLVAAVIFGASQRVAPTPQVAGPLPTSGTSSGPLVDAFATDRGPASADQIAAATRRCVSSAKLPPVSATLFARRVSDGTVTTTALILELEGGYVFHCRSTPALVLDSQVISARATVARPAVVVGGVNTFGSESIGATYRERTTAILSVGPSVAAVDVVASGPGWTEQRFRATPYDGWVYVPVAVSRAAAVQRPSGGAMHPEDVAHPELVVTAYAADGRPLYVQQY